MVRVLALCAIAGTLIRYAWLSDDALITIRTALNQSHGWGPGFNIDDNVQAYTHPLWYLAVLAVGSATNAWILAPMLMGFALSATAAGLILWRVSTWPGVLLASAALLLSNSVIEFGTSGLEGSLAFLLSVLLVVQVNDVADHELVRSVYRFALIGLTSAGLVLTRQDLGLLIGPALALLLLSLRGSWRRTAALLFGALVPLAVWSLYAWIQFGSLLPNTFRAKTNLEIAQSDLVVSGIRWMVTSSYFDPAGFAVIVGGVAVAGFAGSKWMIGWMSGVLLYLAYVVSIGGDFMAGRFWAVPVVVALAAVATCTWRRPWLPPGRLGSRWPNSKALLLTATACLAALSWGRADVLAQKLPTEPRWDLEIEGGGVADEFGWYSPSHTLIGFINAQRVSVEGQDPEMGPSALVTADSVARAWPNAGSSSSVEVRSLPCGSLGISSMLSGPNVHWVDQCALADAFLASLPFRPQDSRWRVGHYVRDLPQGYLDALKVGDPSLVTDPALRALLEDTWSRIRR